MDFTVEWLYLGGICDLQFHWHQPWAPPLFEVPGSDSASTSCIDILGKTERRISSPRVAIKDGWPACTLVANGKTREGVEHAVGGNPDDIPYMDMSRGASVSHEGGVGTLYHTSLPPSNVAPNAQSFFLSCPATKPSPAPVFFKTRALMRPAATHARIDLARACTSWMPRPADPETEIRPRPSTLEGIFQGSN